MYIVKAKKEFKWVICDFAGFFNELIRFETELWDAVDKRLREVHDLPLTWFEPMQVIERTRWRAA